MSTSICYFCGKHNRTRSVYDVLPAACKKCYKELELERKQWRVQAKFKRFQEYIWYTKG